MNNNFKRWKDWKSKDSLLIPNVASWGLNKSRKIQTVSGIAALLLTLVIHFLGVSPGFAGNVSASAYDFGVGMGIASWHASAQHTNDAVSALQYSLRAAEQLRANRVPLNTGSLQGLIGNPPPGLGLHNNIESLRQNFADQIRNTSGNHANVYLLGLHIGLAEGHASLRRTWASGLGYAHRELKNARALIIQNLNNSQNGVNLGFNLSPLDEALTFTQNLNYAQGDAYKKIVTLRNSYADFIRRSSLR